eukprot:TRINITY_DN1346_c8_g1_i1.p1 TRINITY_DN1346_c8_g1~~TRINITY_DN1346_c8_g1_i1.p1  ORF type:complete len:799 (+),score=250.63 TRINITY_DN1346_c8_g1_i1:46-2397(+)
MAFRIGQPPQSRQQRASSEEKVAELRCTMSQSADLRAQLRGRSERLVRECESLRQSPPSAAMRLDPARSMTSVRVGASLRSPVRELAVMAIPPPVHMPAQRCLKGVHRPLPTVGAGSAEMPADPEPDADGSTAYSGSTPAPDDDRRTPVPELAEPCREDTAAAAAPDAGTAESVEVWFAGEEADKSAEGWYSATVVHRKPDGSCDIQFGTGDVVVDVPPSHIRAQSEDVMEREPSDASLGSRRPSVRFAVADAEIVPPPALPPSESGEEAEGAEEALEEQQRGGEQASADAAVWEMTDLLVQVYGLSDSLNYSQFADLCSGLKAGAEVPSLRSFAAKFGDRVTRDQLRGRIGGADPTDTARACRLLRERDRDWRKRRYAYGDTVELYRGKRWVLGSINGGGDPGVSRRAVNVWEGDPLAVVRLTAPSTAVRPGPLPVTTAPCRAVVLSDRGVSVRRPSDDRRKRLRCGAWVRVAEVRGGEARIVAPIPGWVRVRDGVTQLPALGHEPEPQRLTVSTPGPQAAVGGEYILTDTYANGERVWRRADRAYWLYSGQRAHWHIGGKDVHEKRFACSGGWLTSAAPHRGAPPHKIQDWMQYSQATKVAFIPAPLVTVTVAAEPCAAAVEQQVPAASAVMGHCLVSGAVAVALAAAACRVVAPVPECPPPPVEHSARGPRRRSSDGPQTMPSELVISAPAPQAHVSGSYVLRSGGGDAEAAVWACDSNGMLLVSGDGRWQVAPRGRRTEVVFATAAPHRGRAPHRITNWIVWTGESLTAASASVAAMRP